MPKSFSGLGNHWTLTSFADAVVMAAHGTRLGMRCGSGLHDQGLDSLLNPKCLTVFFSEKTTLPPVAPLIQSLRDALVAGIGWCVQSFCGTLMT
eukprot:1448737-Amphidinium_carterae.1